MQKIYLIIFALVVMALNVINASAKQDAIKKYGANVKVAKVEIVGYIKTKKSYINSLKANVNAVTLANFNEQALTSSLFKSGLFSDINVYYTYNSGNKTIEVTAVVSEKSSYVVLPVFASGGGDSSFGFVYLQNNLFGYGKKLITVAIYGKNNKFGLLSVADNNLFNSNFLLRLAVSGNQGDNLFTDINENQYTKLTQHGGNARLALGYKYNNITTIAKYSFAYSKTTKVDTNKVVQKGVNYYIPAIQVEFNNLVYTKNYAYNVKATATGSLAYYKNTNNTVKTTQYKPFVNYNASAATKVFGNDALSIAIDGSWFNKTLQLLDKSGKQGSYTLSNSVALTNNVAGTVSYEFNAFSNKTVTFSIINFAEYGTFKNYFTNIYNNYYGIGTGFRVYLSKTAIPGLGATYYKNFKTNLSGVKVFVGFTF